LHGYTRATTTTLLGAVASNQTAEPIDGLAADTEYCFEVRAVNGAGHLPVPDPAKSCARTLPKPPEIGDMTVTNVPGIENVMCPGSYPVDVVAFRDTNGNGVELVVMALHVDQCGPQRPQFVAFHIDSATGDVIRTVAGDWREKTGPGQEETGVVMRDIDLIMGSPRLIDGRIFGDLSTLVQFYLDLQIAGSPVSFHRGGEVRLDFSTFGVEVQDG